LGQAETYGAYLFAGEAPNSLVGASWLASSTEHVKNVVWDGVITGFGVSKEVVSNDLVPSW
jgi:hypothetical protein